MAHTNLVTGAAGFSGSYVVRELLARGERVIATDRAAGPRRSAHPPDARRDRARPRSSRARDPPGRSAGAGISRSAVRGGVTRVFHTASLYDYSAPLRAPASVNVHGTRNLLTAATRVHARALRPLVDLRRVRQALHRRRLRQDQRAVHRGLALAEDRDRRRADRHRARQRLLDREVAPGAAGVARHREAGLPVTIVRPAPIYGPGSAYGHGGIILAIAAGFVPAIPSDAKHYISASVHVEDVARFRLRRRDRARVARRGLQRRRSQRRLVLRVRPLHRAAHRAAGCATCRSSICAAHVP